jgi:hypothetical protein
MRHECRCGYVYCGEHRYPESHNCKFDHREHAKKILSKNNKAVVADKLKNRLD